MLVLRQQKEKPEDVASHFQGIQSSREPAGGGPHLQLPFASPESGEKMKAKEKNREMEKQQMI